MIPAASVIWCAGMRATPLTRLLGVERDRLGRVPVDEFMRVRGVEGVFAAGDAAGAMMDDTHASVMSCQHGRPMGRFAGHNVVGDLLGHETGDQLPADLPARSRDRREILAAAAPIVQTAPTQYH